MSRKTGRFGVNPLGGLVTAIRTLTSLPVPGRDAGTLTAALPWFPTVGFLLGGIVYAAAVGLSLLTVGRWPGGVAVLLVTLSALLTRALHLDGLADWADGFWGARERDRTLEIMKDSAIGTFGGVALVCVLMTKWVCFAGLLGLDAEIWILCAFIVSRSCQVCLAVTQPYARPVGGTAAPFVKGAAKRHLAGSTGVALALLLAVGRLDWRWPAAYVFGWCATWAFGRWCRRRTGGITGDLLGACSELVEVLTLLAGVLLYLS